MEKKILEFPTRGNRCRLDPAIEAQLDTMLALTNQVIALLKQNRAEREMGCFALLLVVAHTIAMQADDRSALEVALARQVKSLEGLAHEAFDQHHSNAPDSTHDNNKQLRGGKRDADDRSE